MEETEVKTESGNTENNFKDGNEVVDTDREEMVVKRVHVIKKDKKWAVKKQGASRAFRVYDSKQEAIENGRKFKGIGYDLIIHNADGTIKKLEKSKPKRTVKSPEGKGTLNRSDAAKAAKKVTKKRSYKKKKG